MRWRTPDTGHRDLADAIACNLVGRKVLLGRWTHQVVEEYDDGYWLLSRTMQSRAREIATGGRRHLLGAETKGR